MTLQNSAGSSLGTITANNSAVCLLTSPSLNSWNVWISGGSSSSSKAFIGCSLSVGGTLPDVSTNFAPNFGTAWAPWVWFSNPGQHEIVISPGAPFTPSLDGS